MLTEVSLQTNLLTTPNEFLIYTPFIYIITILDSMINQYYIMIVHDWIALILV